MKNFIGKVLFLDRSDINTDEIIPARYLTEITKIALKPYLLEDLVLDGFDNKEDIKDKVVVVSRENFGCGSSREHAPWALEVNGINVVLAENFARIFRQNMFNCGMLAIELPKETIDSLFKKYYGRETIIEVDLKKDKLYVSAGDDSEVIDFTISGFDKTLVEEGGWVEYADKRY
ncbi:MAG: 3-isopropylmalate dehydratase small subunit [Fusobacteria bacterium]|nr:3-isopropylmalate dehydratase small subunit [Fusobacteriota bacterium]